MSKEKLFSIAELYDNRVDRIGDHYRAARYRFRGSFLSRFNEVQEKCLNFEGVRILDAGCGSGIMTAWLAQKNQVVGLDISMKMLHLAGQKSLVPVLGNAFQLPFQSAVFDAVLCIEALQHFEDPLPFLKELLRVARPGALVILSTLNRESIFQKILYQLRITNPELFFHDRLPIQNFLEKEGLGKAEVRFSGFPFPFRWFGKSKKTWYEVFATSWTLFGQKRHL